MKQNLINLPHTIKKSARFELITYYMHNFTLVNRLLEVDFSLKLFSNSMSSGDKKFTLSF